MVKFILGGKGSGKTKIMINMANEAGRNSDGIVVYIDRDKNHIHDLDRCLRFVETADFEIDSLKSFYGFLCGIISQNYDVEKIFIDGQKIITGAKDEHLEEFIKHLKNLGEKFGVSFVISSSRNVEDAPEFLRQYM
ncbi:MAG: hypothetical protein ACOZCL_02385 [Bacillota bacterium]